MKKAAVIICIAILIAMMQSSLVMADTAPANWDEFEQAYPVRSEQLYGSSHLGDVSAHTVPLVIAIYSYQLSATGGLYVDPNDVTVNIDTDVFQITFSGSNQPEAVCLGIITVDIPGNYMPGEQLSVSVNGGTWLPYTSGATFADNEYFIKESAGIMSIQIRKESPNLTFPGISYMIVPSKYNQTAPAAPVVAAKTDTSVTLEEISGAEYKIAGGDWQSSPVFSGLTPATEYTFHARLAETPTQLASPESAGTAATTDKSDQTAPAAPVVAAKTDTSVTLEEISGAEYKIAGGDWQSSPVFSGLTPATEYTFHARLAETPTQLASPESTGTAATTDKSDQTAPAAPVVAAKTDTSVTLEEISGAEYRIAGGDWQSSPVLSGLTPATEYTFHARLAETPTQLASPESTGTAATTDKSNQTAPAAPVVAAKTDTSVTLEEISGAEYRIAGGDWQSSPVFSGLTPVTEYTFHARLAETPTQLASPESTGTAATTDKSDQTAPAAPVVAAKTDTSVTLEEISGAEYRIAGGDWQSSPVFDGLTPATEYTFHARLAETPTQLASPESTGTAATTLPVEDLPVTGENQPILPLLLIGMILAVVVISRRRIIRYSTR